MRWAETEPAGYKSVAAKGLPRQRLDVSKMTKVTKQAKHMSQNANRNGACKGKAGIVALALAGVLAIGGVGAVCIAGVGKSPGQAPVAAQSQTTQKSTTKGTPAKNTTSQASTKSEAQQATKPAAKQQATKQQVAKSATKQTQPVAKPTAKQQATQQQDAKPAAQQQTKPEAQQQTQAPVSNNTNQGASANNDGLEAKVSREQCIATACAHVGAGGQAKGEAKNVTTKGPITGGGTVYYVVELDLGDVHYSVSVDAIEGNVIGADSTHAGTRTLLDEQGNPIDGTEQPVDA